MSRYSKTVDGNQSKTSVFIPGEGYLGRNFRNKGEAIGFVARNYGNDWKQQGIRVVQGVDANKYAYGEW